jgi:hypothetical protein
MDFGISTMTAFAQEVSVKAQGCDGEESAARGNHRLRPTMAHASICAAALAAAC